MTIFIVFDQAMRADTAKRSVLLWACLILMSLSQFVYIFRGETFWRLWDVTEYKEYLISLGIFLYAVELGTRGTEKVTVSTTQTSTS